MVGKSKDSLTLFILNMDKEVLWQTVTVKTQIKCGIRWHFISGGTVC